MAPCKTKKTRYSWPMKKFLFLILMTACSSTQLNHSSEIAGGIGLGVIPIPVKLRDQFTLTAMLTTCDLSPQSKYVVIYGPLPKEDFVVRVSFDKKDSFRTIQNSPLGDYHAVLMDSRKNQVLQDLPFSTKQNDRPKLYFNTCGKTANKN